MLLVSEERTKVADARLGEQLVDNTVAHASSIIGGPTLLADGVQLIEDDDMQPTLVALGFVLFKQSGSYQCDCGASRTSFSASSNNLRMFSSD